MSVIITTSLGDITIDLHTDKCPLTTKSFLKLCKIKYFNGCLFHTVQKDFTAQTGDPSGKGTGGDSIYKFLYGEQARFFGDETHPDLKHSKLGTVAMASAGENLNASQFYITLRDDLDYLDGKHTVFGQVEEGLEVLARINEAYVDDKGRPYKNIRIKHTYIIDDPFDDPPLLAEFIPDRSPEGKPPEEMEDVRLEDDWVPMDEQLDPAELEEAIREREAHTHAVVLETVGDIPDAEIKPPDTVLFVCKLNPVTQDEDLDTIFSRFGNVLSAEVIRDYKTGDSLCYAFIEFEDKEACEQAYFKMDNALIDDRRIHVDFSQSVSKLWSSYRRGGQSQGGKGCFKCGELDHIAKDCTGGSDAKQLPSKYTLKDENRQHGGKGNQSYEMVFDGDNLESLEHGEKNHPGRGTDGEAEKSRRGYQSSEHTRNENRGERSHHGRGIDYGAEKLKRDFQSSEHKRHISRGEKRHHEHETDDEAEKSKRDYQNSEHKRYRDLDRDRRDSSNDRHKHDDRNRGYKEEVRGLEKRKAEHRESTRKDIETQKGDNGASHRREKLDERKKPIQNTDMHRRDDLDDQRRSKDGTRNDLAHDKKRFDHGRDNYLMDDKVD